MTPTGFSYNLTQRRVETLDPTGLNSLSDHTDAGNGHYLVAIEGETADGSDAGPLQVFPFDNKRVALTWTPHQSDIGPNYAVRMFLDLFDYAAPKPRTSTWFALMDHLEHGGGPFCHPYDLATQIKVFPNMWLPDGDCRFFLGGGFAWDGQSHGVEIDFARSPGFGTQFPKEDDVMSSSLYADGGQFVSLAGEKIGVSAPINTWSTLNVDWQGLLNLLFTQIDDNRGRPLFVPPTDPSKMIVEAIFIGMEFYNHDTLIGSGIGDLHITDWRNMNVGRE